MLWRPFLREVGDDVVFLGRVSIRGMRGIHLGNHITVNENCTLDGSGELRVGNFVMIAKDACLYSAQHKFDDLAKPMTLQGYEYKQTVVEDDVWIGAKAVILPGVRVGKGAIVGAGAVVTRDVPPYAIFAGVPARQIGDRKKTEVSAWLEEEGVVPRRGE